MLILSWVQGALATVRINLALAGRFAHDRTGSVVFTIFTGTPLTAAIGRRELVVNVLHLTNNAK